MEPNYSEYSISELEESLRAIDQEAYPERTNELKKELNNRLENPTTSYEVKDGFEANEQFYKCPHCEEKIGFFSKALQSWSKIRECPQCKKPFAVTFNIKVFFIALLPMVIFNYFMIKPVLGSLGLSKSIGLGIVCGVLIIISTRLIRVRDESDATKEV